MSARYTAVRNSPGSSRSARSRSESVVRSSASASAEGTGGVSRSADICHSCRSPPSACCGSRRRLRYTLMNVVVRILFSQARRLVPGVNCWNAA